MTSRLDPILSALIAAALASAVAFGLYRLTRPCRDYVATGIECDSTDHVYVSRPRLDDSGRWDEYCECRE